MNRILEVFGRPRVLLPVIHPVSRESALGGVEIAHRAGCRGVFLIDQGMSAGEVLGLLLEVRRRWPDLWVGLNLLSDEPKEALRHALSACEGRLDGLWSDNALIDERSTSQPAAQQFLDARRELGWEGLFFGGVAFKYQRPVPPEDLGRAASTAAPYMDVICTSGPGTGYAAEAGKVATMRSGVGPSHAMALASGVTEDNVADYLPYVEAYLVGTSLEVSLGTLDPARVERLRVAIEGA